MISSRPSPYYPLLMDGLKPYFKKVETLTDFSTGSGQGRIFWYLTGKVGKNPNELFRALEDIISGFGMKVDLVDSTQNFINDSLYCGIKVIVSPRLDILDL